MTAISNADEPFKLEPGFVSMFNGQDFSGWQFGGGYALPDPLPENWSVADGAIKVSGGGKPHLGSQWDYEDFDMRFQWRGMREKYNSGFFIRSNRNVGNNQINLAKGGEGRFFGGKMTGGNAVPELQNPPMEWNEWRVLVEGDKVTFWCNGKLAWEGTEFQSQRGHIGLQAEGAPLEFRNLRIKECGVDYLVGDAPADSFTSAKTDYKDYVLRFEFQAAEKAIAMIGLRGKTDATSSLTIGDLEVGSGGISSLNASPLEKKDNPVGQWNYLEARVADGKLAVWLNGAEVVKQRDFPADDVPKTGGIATNANSASVQFRNVRVKDLSRD